MVLVNTLETAVVGHQAVDFTLDISSLGPDATAASEALYLVLQLTQEKVATVVPSFDSRIDFIGLVDGIDRSLVVPEANGISEILQLYLEKDLLLDRDVISDSTELALESDSGIVIGA